MSHQQRHGQGLGAGSLPNYQVHHCVICEQNGFPCEAIRRLYNGRNIDVVDYNTGRKHLRPLVTESGYVQYIPYNFMVNSRHYCVQLYQQATQAQSKELRHEEISEIYARK